MSMNSVVVSRECRIFACSNTPEGWICGACGFGRLGYAPLVGLACPQCSARIEEVLKDRRRT